MSATARETPALEHLRLWLRALNRVLALAVSQQQKQALEASASERRADCITVPHATQLLRDAIRTGQTGFPPLARFDLLDAELEAERALRQRFPDAAPPLLTLRDAGLVDAELAAVVIVAAPELSTAYGRLYGYVVDDLTRSEPTIELVLRLTSGDPLPLARRRRLLAAQATLRRCGLLVAEARAGERELPMPLGLGPGVLEWLIGARQRAPVRLDDPDLIDPQREGVEPLECGSTPEAAPALACVARAGVVGIWGHGRVGDLACALAAAAERRRYRLPAAGDSPLQTLAAALHRAAHEDAILWIDADVLRRDASPAHVDLLGARLAACTVPVVLSGRVPWRPERVLERGAYVELEASPLGPFAACWPEAAEHERAGARVAAQTYRFDWSERRTALALARGTQNGAAPSPEFADALSSACRLVATPAAGRFVDVVEPRRSPEDLILPEELHRQVLQIAGFYASAAQVDGHWGLGHTATGSGGLKVLFTGEPGTGKTLAAEVIAKQLGRSLLKVDLSQIVSKWIGETEKNLEQVFSHAEDGHGVLFFDEADTLFGKRGEVRYGTDRYANLEVGYLLQRLDGFSGLALLASNLRDEIDPAFTRRFQLTMHFPRPGEPERLRLWELAFAHGSPLDPSVDLDELAELDLTGASIVAAARLAGLLAASESSRSIRLDHLAEAISRQFRQQARLLRGREIGRLRLEQGSSA